MSHDTNTTLHQSAAPHIAATAIEPTDSDDSLVQIRPVDRQA